MNAVGPRRGFALVVTLWVLVGGAALAIVAGTEAREGLEATRNRSNYQVAYWLAEGCVERVQYAISRALWTDGFTAASVSRVWLNLDSAAIGGPTEPASGCGLSIEPAGLQLDVNTATSDQLERLTTALGIAPEHSDSLVDAILDWRDADDGARPFGAERDWYRAHRLGNPRNDRLIVPQELRGIRGVADVPALLMSLGVDSARVLWTRASPAVLASLPGMTAEALAVFAAHRKEIADLSTLSAFPELSSAARDTLASNAAALIQTTTTSPDWWEIQVHASAGQPAMTCDMQLRIALGDGRLIVLRRLVDP